MTDTILVPAILPMQPWDYLRRRRLLAGLTIEQAALPFHRNAKDRADHARIRADVERNMRDFERPGIVMKPWVAAEATRVFDLDLTIYRQLQDLPQYHPTLCRCCGSSEAEPRVTDDGEAARLDADLICKACREDQRRADHRRIAA